MAIDSMKEKRDLVENIFSDPVIIKSLLAMHKFR